MRVMERLNSFGECMQKSMKVALLLCIFLFAAGIVAQSAEGPKHGDNSSRPAEGAPDSAAPADYVIGADDVLKFSAWKEPDLSETLPVRPDGKISMPLLND